MINIRSTGGDTYEVDITESVETTHQVTVPEDYFRRLTSGNVSKERFIEESFKFLLEREPNTAILSRFSIEVIEDYFPEYAEEIAKRLT